MAAVLTASSIRKSDCERNQPLDSYFLTKSPVAGSVTWTFNALSSWQCTGATKAGLDSAFAPVVDYRKLSALPRPAFGFGAGGALDGIAPATPADEVSGRTSPVKGADAASPDIRGSRLQASFPVAVTSKTSAASAGPAGRSYTVSRPGVETAFRSFTFAPSDYRPAEPGEVVNSLDPSADTIKKSSFGAEPTVRNGVVPEASVSGLNAAAQLSSVEKKEPGGLVISGVPAKPSARLQESVAAAGGTVGLIAPPTIAGANASRPAFVQEPTRAALVPTSDVARNEAGLAPVSWVDAGLYGAKAGSAQDGATFVAPQSAGFAPSQPPDTTGSAGASGGASGLAINRASAPADTGEAGQGSEKLMFDAGGEPAPAATGLAMVELPTSAPAPHGVGRLEDKVEASRTKPDDLAFAGKVTPGPLPTVDRSFEGQSAGMRSVPVSDAAQLVGTRSSVPFAAGEPAPASEDFVKFRPQPPAASSRATPGAFQHSIGDLRMTGQGIEFTTIARTSDKLSGRVGILISEDDNILVKVGDIVALVQPLLRPDKFERFNRSLAAKQYVSLNTLRAAGVPVRFQANDELSLGPQ